MERPFLAGRYELREQLGDSTWLAADHELGRDVVVRFGEVAGETLSHPSIARVFDRGEEGGERFAVLEHLPGGTLAERGALPEESAAGLAAALAHAHAQGVAHGALDADAVLFDAEGRAKLTGFLGTGDPDADLAALAALRSEYAVTEVRAPESATAVVPPPPPAGRRSRRGLVAAVLAALVLAAAGLAAALLAAGDDDGGQGFTGTTDPITSATVPTDTDEEPAPPPSTTDETTATTATTGTTDTTEPATTETQPPTTDTIAPPVPTEPPLPSIPTTTELPTEPVTTVQEPPPPTDTQE